MTEDSPLDRLLKTAAGKLLQNLEAALPADSAALILFYNRVGSTLDLSVISMRDRPGETLKILRLATGAVLKNFSGDETWYVPAGAVEVGGSPQDLVSSAALVRFGGHERVRLWTRGALSGELMFTVGDGIEFLEKALGFVAVEGGKTNG